MDVVLHVNVNRFVVLFLSLQTAAVPAIPLKTEGYQKISKTRPGHLRRRFFAMQKTLGSDCRLAAKPRGSGKLSPLSEWRFGFDTCVQKTGSKVLPYSELRLSITYPPRDPGRHSLTLSRRVFAARWRA